MEYITREGTQDVRPADVDFVSSADTVYFRRNQRQVEEKDENGQTFTKWVYEEAEMNREEYEAMRSPLACQIMQANTELIAKNELLQIEVEMLLDLVTPAE